MAYLTSFTFNGTSSDPLLRVTKVTRSVLSVENKFIDVDGMSGQFFVSKKIQARKISVDVVLMATSDTDLRTKHRTLADWLDVSAPSALVFSDEPTLTDYAILDGDTNLDEIYKYGVGTLTFICPDPYSTGSSQSKNLVAGSNNVTYAGTAPVYPTLTVTFASSQPTFSISNGTSTVLITATLGTTTTLVIDMNTGKITINGTPNQQTLSYTSDFFPLVKGTNTLTVSTGASVTMTYKDKFK